MWVDLLEHVMDDCLVVAKVALMVGTKVVRMVDLSFITTTTTIKHLYTRLINNDRYQEANKGARTAENHCITMDVMYRSH